MYYQSFTPIINWCEGFAEPIGISHLTLSTIIMVWSSWNFGLDFRWIAQTCWIVTWARPAQKSWHWFDYFKVWNERAWWWLKENHMFLSNKNLLQPECESLCLFFSHLLFLSLSQTNWLTYWCSLWVKVLSASYIAVIVSVLHPQDLHLMTNQTMFY